MKDLEVTKAEKREKRSAFLSRMVDEFKKIGFIWTVVFCMGTIVWCMILYTKGITTPGLQVVASVAFGIIGTAFTVYCNAASKDKDSLNKNGLTKGKDGSIVGIISTVVDAVTNKKDDTPEG